MRRAARDRTGFQMIEAERTNRKSLGGGAISPTDAPHPIEKRPPFIQKNAPPSFKTIAISEILKCEWWLLKVAFPDNSYPPLPPP